MKLERDVVILYILSLVIPISFNLTLIALPLKALDNGLTRGTVALVILVSNAFQILGRPFAGLLGDRIGTKIPIIIATTLYTMAYISFYIAYDLFTLLFSSLLQGLAVSFFWTSVFSHTVRLNWSDAAFSVGSTLSVSFTGSVIGAALSGFFVEFFGYNFTFLFSSLLTTVSLVFSLLLHNVGGGNHVSASTAFKITFKNISETFKSINSVAVFPLLRTYGTIILLDAGLSEGLVGLIFTGTRILNVLGQYPAAKFYDFIVEHRYAINILALTMYIPFVFLATKGTVYISISFLMLSIFASSLLPTGQLTKATSENTKYASLGAGGFGTGLSVLRFIYTGLGSTTGAFAETHNTSIEPEKIAFILPILLMLAVSIFSWLTEKVFSTKEASEKKLQLNNP